MKKIPFYLLLIYLFSLAIALFGYWIDTDEPTNSFAFQMFEVFMLSLIICALLLVFLFTPYFLFKFFKKITKGSY
jgi:hypothetical protein